MQKADGNTETAVVVRRNRENAETGAAPLCLLLPSEAMKGEGGDAAKVAAVAVTF